MALTEAESFYNLERLHRDAYQVLAEGQCTWELLAFEGLPVFTLALIIWGIF